MTASDLSASLDGWIHFAEFGCWLVIIGIVGESVDLIIKWWKKRKFRVGFGIRFDDINRGRIDGLVKRARWHVLEIETISLALVVVGLVIEVEASHKVYRISDSQNAALNREAGLARQNAGDAIKLASKFNERAAAFEKQSEELRSENLKLQLQLQPRRITVQQVTNFMFLTQKINRTIPIKVYVGQNEGDTWNYAFQVREMLTSAGFKTDSSANFMGVTVDPSAISYLPIANEALAKGPFFVQVITYGTNGTWMFPAIGYEFTNGLIRPIVTENDTNKIYRAISESLNQIGVTTIPGVSPNWVKPGECELYVPTKSF